MIYILENVIAVMKWFTFNIFLLRHWCYVRSRLWYIPGNPSVFMEWFTPNISAASYIMIAHCETYAWLSSDFNSEIFLHNIIRKRENKLCQSPACRHHVLLSNFHDTVRCNSWNIKKKNIKILWMIWWNYLTPVSEPQHVQATIWVFAEEMEFNFISLW